MDGSAAVDVHATTKEGGKKADRLQLDVDPSFLLPPKARVLLTIVNSRRTISRSGRYVCMMLHVRGVRCLTFSTHLHTPQKAASSQPLPLEMVKAGGKRARSTSPSSARQTRSTHKR